MDENRAIADRLHEAAALLEAQGASPFRVAAYRNAATSISELSAPVRSVFETEGIAGLVAMPHVGRGIASVIAELLATGRWNQLERLRGTSDPQTLFRNVPGIGPTLARRIHETLHVDTLEALEAAAHDKRLESVPGVGARRAAACRAMLDAMLKRVRPSGNLARPPQSRRPTVATVLEVDHEYRREAEAGGLPTIAPRRFNPEHKAWLPVLHTERAGWHFTALYSNTATAHTLKRTHDWVVVYFYDDEHQEGQHTVVTETRGPLAGKRVVRGRETECQELYTNTP